MQGLILHRAIIQTVLGKRPDRRWIRNIENVINNKNIEKAKTIIKQFQTWIGRNIEKERNNIEKLMFRSKVFGKCGFTS